ncbi:MAG: hypothetical protein ACYC61_03420 [Isosphaeraceae bacterium]
MIRQSPRSSTKFPAIEDRKVIAGAVENLLAPGPMLDSNNMNIRHEKMPG